MAFSSANASRRKIAAAGFCLGAAFFAASCLEDPQDYPPENPDETYTQQIAFADIDSKGTPELKALVRDLRKSSMGQDFYNFAVAKNIRFQWSKGTGATYQFLPEGGLVSVGIENKPDEALLAVVHELQHGVQDKVYGRTDYAFGIRTTWGLTRLWEANACAMTIDYAVNYQKETGKTLKGDRKFYGYRTLSRFMSIPESQRDYLSHAVEPCFKEMNGTIYDRMSLYNTMVLTLTNTALDGTSANVTDPGATKNILSRYFSRSPKSNEPDQAIVRMKPEDFHAWFDTISKPKDPEVELSILSLELKELELKIEKASPQWRPGS